MSTVQSLDTRMDDLEARLAFQDDLIESLNDVVSRQDRELARLADRLLRLEARLQDLAAAAGGPDDAQGHEVPPHY